MNIDQQSILKDIFSTLPFKNPRRIKREKRRLSKPLMVRQFIWLFATFKVMNFFS